MSRNLGQSNFSGNFEVFKTAPLDSRQLVDKYDDLILPTTWSNNSDSNKYVYVGMTVACLDMPGKLFQLINEDYTKVDSWKSISGDNSGTVSGLTDITVNNVKATKVDTSASVTIKGSDIEVANDYTTTKYPDKFDNNAQHVEASDKVGSAFKKVEATISALVTDVNTSTSNITSLTEKVNANTNAISTLNGEEEVNGSVKKIASGYAASAETKAKGYTDTKIGALSFKSDAITRGETAGDTDKVAVSGTNVEDAITSLATSIKGVEKSIPTYTIKKIDNTDNSLGENIQEAYQLTKNGTERVDVLIPVYKASSLKEIKAVKEGGVDYIVFVYINDKGVESETKFDASKLISLATYTFTNGLQEKDGTVSILLDNTEGSDTSYLSTSKKGLKLSGIKTAIAKSKTEVAGGNGISISVPTEETDGPSKYTISLKLRKDEGQILTLDENGLYATLNGTTLDAGTY